VILVRQFRYPVYAGLLPEEREGDGAKQAWLLEIVAGIVDERGAVKEVAHRELLEEAGYRVEGELQPLTTIYPSPGGTSERIHLFLGEVDRRQRAARRGGIAAEGEYTQVAVLLVREAMDMIDKGEIRDAKTLIALQYLALLKARSTNVGNPL
jgi:ADP-ribose pyrophosphatase